MISYIAPGAPATRRAATGTEAYLRPEIGFTPAWYRQHLDVDFGESWHTDPAYRRDALSAMHVLLRERFPDTTIGRTGSQAETLDLLTGLFGTCSVAAIYGVPLIYAANNWPDSGRRYLTDEEIDHLQPPDLDANPHFQGIIRQVDWIAEREGRVEGFINWQGVLNNAQRLRGEQLLVDMLTAPDRARHLFECVHATMTEAAQRLHAPLCTLAGALLNRCVAHPGQTAHLLDGQPRGQRFQGQDLHLHCH